MTNLDARIAEALADAPDGRSPVDLAETTGATYAVVLEALDRLASAGIVERDKRRAGGWRLAGGACGRVGGDP